MRFRWLALFPLLFAAAFCAAAWWLLGGEALAPFNYWQRILTRVLGIAGCAAAVSCFERGDHLRRAWLWLAAGTVVILIRDLLRLVPEFQPASASLAAQAVVSALGVGSNLCQLTGVWMLSRSWKMASITLPGGRSGFLGVGAVTAALAVLVAGPGALESGRALAGGDLGALVLFVSAVVDIVALCLVAPLLLTAVSLRGGLFVWPWALVTASRLSWLLYDAAVAAEPLRSGFPLSDVFRGLGMNYLFAAGLAQLLVVRQVRRAAVRPAPGLSGTPAY